MEKAFEIDCQRLYNLCVLIQKAMAPNLFAEYLFRLYLSVEMVVIDKDATDHQKSLLGGVNPLVYAIKDSASFSEPNIYAFLERQRDVEFQAWKLSEDRPHEQGISGIH